MTPWELRSLILVWSDICAFDDANLLTITTLSRIALETHDLSVVYQKRPALYGVDVAIEEGSLVGIIGPNGAGKSTFIKAAIGLVPTSGGWVQAFEKPVKKVRKQIGYVPQRESVDWDFPISVLDVALMGTFGKLGLWGRPTKEDKIRAEEALDKVGLLDYRHQQIGNLSGGQQQRAFLARALAQDADLYLICLLYTSPSPRDA